MRNKHEIHLDPPPGGELVGAGSPLHFWANKSAVVRIRGLAVISLFLVMTMVILTPAAAADDSPPSIEVQVDHEEADTWSSVLVMILIPPVVDADNVTYYVDREVRLSLIDMDRERVIAMENVNVSSGIGTFTFRILPDWGEFLMHIKVLDYNLTGDSDVARLKVVYSMDWVIYQLTLTFEDIAQGTRDDNAASNLRQERMTQFMFVIVFTLVPIALLRLEHRSARRMGRSSFWDRSVDRWFDYTLTQPGMWHYLEDDAYGFSTSGRKAFKKVRLEFGREQVQVDIAALTTIDTKLAEEIAELTPKPKVPDATPQTAEKGAKET